MPSKGTKQPVRLTGDMTHPWSLGTLLLGFLQWKRERNYATSTIDLNRRHLSHFIGWCEERSYQHPSELTRPVLERYQRHLTQRIDRYGKPASVRDQMRRLISLRAWFRWLARQQHIPHNVALELELPRAIHTLPQYVLSPSQVEEILAQPDIMNTLGLRDRSILETFYSTGIRRAELIRLKLHDVDAERGVLAIRQGKGNRDRMVPIGRRALAWLQKYLLEARPVLAVRPAETTLYLTRLGDPFSPSPLGSLVRQYLDSAGINARGSCHLFRHAMATAMLNNGADTRFIQAILGHQKLDTTQIYTRVSITKLKEVHERTHPSKMPGDQ